MNTTTLRSTSPWCIFSKADSTSSRPMVSETIGLGDVEAAFERMHKGEVLRSVVVFDK